MAIFAGLALGSKLLGVRKKLAKVPWQVWAVIAIVILVGVGGCIAKNKHEKAVEEFGTERYNAGRASRDAEITALQNQLNAKLAPIVTDVKEKHRAADTTIVKRADAMLLRGPGKASCPNPTSVPGATSGHEGSVGAGDAAVAGVPDSGGERIALPFADTVAFGRQCDQYRNTANTWNEWYNRIAAEWAKAAAEADRTR